MKIKNICNKVIKCNLQCEGIVNNKKKGISSRGVYLEKRKGKNKCIILGLNPGDIGEKQREYYLKHKLSYKSQQRYFEKILKHKRMYFGRARDFVTMLGFRGDILWTNLAKCQSQKGVKQVPMQTLRICIKRFLQKEIKTFKCDTIFAVGNNSYDFCALSFPNHFVIGIPHVSGSHGDFDYLNKKVKANPSKFIKQLKPRKDKNGNYRAIKLR